MKWDEEAVAAALMGDDADAAARAIREADTTTLLLASATAINRLRHERDALRTSPYYRGVADAMDVIRAYDFPLTERVDHIADKLAPSSTSAQAKQREGGV